MAQRPWQPVQPLQLRLAPRAPACRVRRGAGWWVLCSTRLARLARVARGTWRFGSSLRESKSEAVAEALAEHGDVQGASFGLLFVPCRWGKEMKEMVEEIPVRPLVAVPSSGEMLTFGSAAVSSVQVAVLDEKTLQDISRESVRIQDTIDENPLLSIQVYGGKVNGSMLAGRNFLGEARSVDSVLIFGQGPLVRRVVGLLDMCYPFAQKVGLLADAAVCLAGREERPGSCVVLLLPVALGSSLNFCGVKPVGPELPVFDADVRRGIIRRVQDLSATGEPGDRLPSLAAAEALRRLAKDEAVAEEEIWLGLPRVAGRDRAQLRVAPGAGEWALYPWGVVSAEGSLVLRENPRVEGLAKSIDRIQLFTAAPDLKAVERLGRAYDLEALATASLPQVPRLCLASGEHSKHSKAHAIGQAVIGCPGTSLPSARQATSMHRQAVCLAMLYSSPSPMRATGALDTGAD